MTRRRFVPSAAAGAALAAQTAESKPSVYELRWVRMRNTADNQRQRLSDLLERAAIPAFKRAGIGPLGFFSIALGPDSPSVLALVNYPSLAALEERRARLSADGDYQKAVEAYNAAPGPGYVRIESSLARAFPSFPGPEPPPLDAKRSPHVFELRMYESSNTHSLARKIKMFESGEIGIFRRLGMRPVFFAETFAGARMPNLVYMLAFESLAAREQAWRAFGADPEWLKLRAAPGFADAEIVSNISSWILQPLPFSPIR